MSWISVSLEAASVKAEALSDALMEVGALSATIEDALAGTPEETPQFGEPGMDNAPCWDHARLSVLFEPDADVAGLIAAASALVGIEPPAYTSSTLEEQNWVQLTQSQFDPIEISKRLWIVPSWHEAPYPDAINLILDPGMAFGTGSHPTTHMCLQWLEARILPGQSLLDYGCGSGILAIAGARLGAGQVDGLDIDPLAVQAAHDNAKRNGVEARFFDSNQPLQQGGVLRQYDRVVANILANPLRALAPALCAHVKPGGELALAGLLAEQAEELVEVYAPWIKLEVFAQRDGWACLSGKKD